MALEVRIACYATCDTCGTVGRKEVPAAVPTPWSTPKLQLPQGWAADNVIGPAGPGERHTCPECVAARQKKAAQPDAPPPDGKAS